MKTASVDVSGVDQAYLNQINDIIKKAKEEKKILDAVGALEEAIGGGEVSAVVKARLMKLIGKGLSIPTSSGKKEDRKASVKKDRKEAMWKEFFGGLAAEASFSISDIRAKFPDELAGRNVGSFFADQIQAERKADRLSDNGEKTAKFRYIKK